MRGPSAAATCWTPIVAIPSGTMTKPAQRLLNEALGLDEAERALLAAELIASLDGPADSDVESAWAREIERRAADIDEDPSAFRDWSDVKRRIADRISR